LAVVLKAYEYLGSEFYLVIMIKIFLLTKKLKTKTARKFELYGCYKSGKLNEVF
jgi:hypothetical protein